MSKLFQKNSKRGITLVESVIAVVLLGFAATGILTMLVVSGTKIFQLGSQSSAYAEATQQMDLVISAISNAQAQTSTYIEPSTGDLKISALKSAVGIDADTQITAAAELYERFEGEASTPSKIRGWQLTLTYKGATVKAFASNTKGVFDS